MTVEVDGTPIEAPAGRRAWGLLAWLALHPGPHARGELAARFWPDVLDSSARASLRSAVWALRRDLGDAGGAHVAATRDHVELDGDVWVDAREFDALVAEGELASAADLGDGALLAGFEDEWALRARDEHRDRLVDVLERLAEKASEPSTALAYTRRQVALEPMGEEVHRRLMQRLADTGDRPAALAAYDRLRERLRRELGMAPSAATRELAEALRREDAPSAAGGERAVGTPGADGANGRGGARAVDAPSPRPGGRRLLPLVGRERELETLLQAWDEARSGAGAVVVLRGEAGIGKTRLATELLDRARAQGACGAACAGLELGGGAPLGLWAELAAELGRDVPVPPPESAWPDDLSRLAPELAARFERDPAGRPDVPPDLERARLFQAASELVAWAAHDRPVVLVMEDLHLADDLSLDLAGYVARRVPQLRVLVVLTRRELPRCPAVDALEQALRARGALAAELALAPLEDSAVATLSRAVGALDDEHVAQVVGAAEGNALLAVEQARALAAGELEPPASLRGAVRAAMAPLADDARRVAELTAVAGRDLDAGELVALPLDDPRAAASRAVQTGLLDAGDGRLGYRHALLREAVYADLPGPHRAHLHEAIATVLIERADPGVGRRAAETARHFRLAGQDERAVEQLARAADHARAVGAIEEAAGFLAEALELRPDDTDLLLAASDVEAWRGRRAEAEARFEQALATLDCERDPLACATAWLHLERGYHGPICYPRGVLRTSTRVLEILDDAGIEAPDLRLEALSARAWSEAIAGDPDESERLLRQIHELAGGEITDELLRFDIGHARQLSCIRREQFREAYGPSIAAGSDATRAGRPDLSAGVWINAAAAAMAAGEHDRAEEFIDRSLEALDGIGTFGLELLTWSARAHLYLRVGRLDDARDAAARSNDLAERLGSPEYTGLARCDSGLVALARGEHERAADLLARALEDEEAPISRPVARLARAEALAALQRCDEADAEIRATALEPVGPADFPDTLVARLTRVQGLVAAARGDETLAERRLQESADAWRRITDRGRGDRMHAVFADFGRPAIGIVEPALELERVEAELEELHAAVQ
jgi:DNA-binding SARP family transcriptional activator/tetratricopeptide (TPR) repeat protein